jgi:hypothetical protein
LGKAKKQKKDLKRKKKEEVQLLEYIDSALPDIVENKPKPTEAGFQILILYMNFVATGKICRKTKEFWKKQRKALLERLLSPHVEPLSFNTDGHSQHKCRIGRNERFDGLLADVAERNR